MQDGELIADAVDLGAPEDWQLKAQGNANAVFSYIGDEPRLVGRVLRIRKRSMWSAGELDRESWAALHAQAEAGAATLEQLYVQQELAPLLGARHIPPQEPVTPTPALLQALASSPAWQPLELDAERPGAVLMPDVTRLPPANSWPPASAAAAAGPALGGGSGAVAGPAVCVEIKPKCGFVTSCRTVHPADVEIKRSGSRFQLHQILKHAAGDVTQRSEYDPRDLFSRCPQRVQHALLALVRHPQNNLRAFLDGRACWGAGGEEEGAGLPGAAEALTGLRRPEAVQAVVRLLRSILLREGVLDRLLVAQQSCPYDVEGVHALYSHLTGQGQPGTAAGEPCAEPHTAPGEKEEAEQEEEQQQEGACVQRAWGEALHALLGLPREQALGVLRSYVVSATAKDCALMVTMRRLAAGVQPPPSAGTDGGGGRRGAATSSGCRGEAAASSRGACSAALPEPEAGPGPCSEALDAETGVRVAYCVAFVDLDRKPLDKIPGHRQLDVQIVRVAREHGERRRGEGGVALPERPASG